MNTSKENLLGHVATKSLFAGMVPLLVLGHFGHHLLTALPVPLLPMIRSDFALDYTRAGLVISAFNLSYGIGQVPAGWIADRVGSRVMITIGICGVAVAGFLVGLSPTYWVLIAFMGLMGLMGGGYHPAAPPVIAAAVEPQKLGQALGLHIIGGSASYFLAPIIAAGIAAFWGWRGAFMGLAAPAIVFGIYFYIMLGRITARKSGAGATVVRSEVPPEPGRLRHLIAFIVLSTLTQAVMNSVVSFIPLYTVDKFGVSKEAAAAFISIFYVTGLWTAPLAGYFSDRVGTVRMILAICFVAGPTIFLLGVAPHQILFGALVLFLGMITYARMPVSESYVVGQTSENNRSTILGVYYFSSMEGSGVLAPVIGYLIDRMGFFSAFSICGLAVFMVTLVCSVWLLGRRG